MPEPIIDIVTPSPPPAGNGAITTPAAPGAAGGATATPAAAPADWRDALPEDIRYDKALESFKGPDAAILPHMAKSYLNAQQMIGRDKLPMPKSDAEFEEFYTKLGRPETPDGYKFERPAMPEGVVWDEAGEKTFRAMAHADGLSQNQAQKMLNGLVALRLKEAQDAAQAWQTKAREQQDVLKNEWGQAYDPLTKQAGMVVTQYGGEAAQQALVTAGLDNHPAIVGMMGRLARELMGVQKLKGAEPSQAMTPAEYTARISDYRNDHHEALTDATHPDHARRAAELTDLYARKHGVT